MAAVLAAGEGAALSHLSAAALWGIWRRAPGRIDVTVPRQRRPQSGFHVHTSRTLRSRDVITRDGIRSRPSPARSST